MPLARYRELELHRRIGEVIKQTGLVTAKQWRESRLRFGHNFVCSLYYLAHRSVKYGEHFFGYGNWYSYLRKYHGVTPPRSALERISNKELHELISQALQKTGLSNAMRWKDTTPVVGKYSLWSLYDLARNRKVRGRLFFGYSTWANYMEKKHGVVSLEEKRWSDERLHRTIALLLKKYPARKVNWAASLMPPVIHSKSLFNLFALAVRSNRPLNTNNRPQRRFFGHSTWRNYAEWVKKTFH